MTRKRRIPYKDLSPIAATPLFLAYLAGIIDGEAWIGTRVVRNAGCPVRYTPTLRIAQAHEAGRAFLSDIREFIGGLGYVHRGVSDCYELVLDGVNAARVLKAVLPYIVIKEKQAKLAIALQEFRSRYRDPRVEECAHDALKALNARKVA